MNRAKGTLLIVDDSRDDRELLRAALAEAGLSNPVRELDDGQAAIDLLAGAEPLPVLVLLDLKMPGKNGFDVLQAKAAIPRARLVPALVLSASNFPADVRRAYELGALSCFLKPSSLGELIELAALIKKYWLERAELPPA